MTTISLLKSEDIVFAVLMCVGCGVAFLLPSPEKVERKDGSKVKVAPPVPVWDAIKAYWRSLTEKRVSVRFSFLCLLIEISRYFYYSHCFSSRSSTTRT